MQDEHRLQVQLRRSCDTLKSVGLGVIAFGIWSILKTVLYSTLQWDTIAGEMADPEMNETAAKILYYIILAMFMGIGLALRLRIGLSAISESQGKTKHRGYPALAITMLVFNLTVLIVGFVLGSSAQPLTGLAVAVVVEATSIYTLLEISLSAIRVRKLRRQLAWQG